MEYCLVTGGTGYIGSHIVVDLLESYNVIIFDNLSNSLCGVVTIIENITGKCPIFIKGDLLDYELLEDVFIKYNITFVIHCAGLKSVAMSIKSPLDYYDNNISGTINLLRIMQKSSCYKLIFSSSCTVYGTNSNEYDKIKSINENDKTGINITNPYGKTKYLIEEMLKDLYASNLSWSIVILRYANPIGAHNSGLIGENPNNNPTNIFPIVLKVANRTFDHLNIFGNDYKTSDGTAVRDYIHVMDLANGHICSIKKLYNSGVHIYNLGSGTGHSVHELVSTFEKVSGVTIPYKFTEKRNGDIPSIVLSVQKANNELNWKCKYSLYDMCKDGYKYMLVNKTTLSFL